MFTNLPKEEIDLINMLKLLEDTFIGKNTKKVEEAKYKLEQIEIKQEDYLDVVKEAEKAVKQALKEIGEML